MKARPDSRQRLWAFLLGLGASVVLFRTARMVYQGALGILVPWVGALLIAELLVDLTVLLLAVRWWLKNDDSYSSLPLRFGAAAAILHAFRVLIFVMGRAGPWIDFDVIPAERAMHGERWAWGWVYFASIMAVLGIVGVIVIWRLRRKPAPAVSTVQPHANP